MYHCEEILKANKIIMPNETIPVRETVIQPADHRIGEEYGV